MKEDIEILESECYYLEELGYLRENNHFIRFNQALENLIKGYRELEEQNEDLKNDLHHDGLAHKYLTLKATAIPKSKIKEKIEELEKQYKQMEQTSDFIIADIIQPKIQVLQELIED